MKPEKIILIKKIAKPTFVIAGLVVLFFIYRGIELTFHSDVSNGVITAVDVSRAKDHRQGRFGHNHSVSYYVKYKFKLEDDTYTGSQNIYGSAFLLGLHLNLSKGSGIRIRYSKSFPSLNEVYLEQ